MEALLSRMTQQAVHYAIRSGISITTGYAIKECSKLLKQAPRGKAHDHLRILQARLDDKIRVIAPSIDMIELIAARGNTSLESALSLTNNLRNEIQKLGSHLKQAAERELNPTSQTREGNERDLCFIIKEMESLLARIDAAVPLVNLAITTSGVSLSSKLSATISPTRLLQASTFLTTADRRFNSAPSHRHQVGPTCTVKLYMLFKAHTHHLVDRNNTRKPIWKEVIRKARIKLWRVPLEQLYSLPDSQVDLDYHPSSHTMPADIKAGEFAYQVVLVEDQDGDGLHHDPGSCAPFDDVPMAGIRDLIPVHEISKIFYADTGKLLGIGDDRESSPVLLLKRDVHADPPRRMLLHTLSRQSLADEQLIHHPEQNCDLINEQSEIDCQVERECAPTISATGSKQSPSQKGWCLPPDLDPEWLALEVSREDQSEPQSDEDSLDGESPSAASKLAITENALATAFSTLNLHSTLSMALNPENSIVESCSSPSGLSPTRRAGASIKTSLSLLEMLLKLASLQQFRQECHLAVEDELLAFFLEDSATVGAEGDKEYRQRVRRDATQRVGFDPYDDSPVKRRGETARNGHEKYQRGSQYMHGVELGDAFEPDTSLPKLNFAVPSIEQPSSLESATYSRPEQILQPPRYSTPNGHGLCDIACDEDHGSTSSPRNTDDICLSVARE